MKLEGREEDLAMPDSDAVHSIPLPPVAWPDAAQLLAAVSGMTSLPASH